MAVAQEIKTVDLEITREETDGLQGVIRLLFVRDSSGRLTWARKDEDGRSFETVAGYWPGVWYRRREIDSSGDEGRVLERGTIEVLGEGQRWSQDGLRVRGAFPVPYSFPTPVACFVDVDLQGDWALNLNVTRDAYVPDARSVRFGRKFYALLARLLAKVLADEMMLPVDEKSRGFVHELIRRSPPALRTELEKESGYKLAAPAW